MRNSALLSVLWRRKWIVASVFVTFVVVTAVLSKSLHKVYATDSTLLIAASSPGQTVAFDRVQASQALARSYADIIKSPNIAHLVATRLADGSSRGYVQAHTTFQPVAQTQLLKITAEDGNQARAKRLADTYAAVFIEYARRRLAQSTKGDISLADSAPFPTEPARPKPTLYTLVGALLGLLLGVALALLRERFDRRLRTAGEVESQFAVPVLGRVPRRGRTEASAAAFNEAYRLLRTNLQFVRGRDGKLDSIAVTSAAEGEGKTTSVVQLAIAHAEVGMEVIVLEGDLRRPSLQDGFGTERDPQAPGMSNYLVEAVSVEDVIYATGRPNVSLVPSGPLPPSPAALLEARATQRLVQELLARCDLLVIDCPPLSVAADASVLSSLVDGVIMVVNLPTSREDMVRDSMRQLEAVQAPVLGLLLNRDREAELSRYKHYRAPEQKRGIRNGGRRVTAGTRR